MNDFGFQSLQKNHSKEPADPTKSKSGETFFERNTGQVIEKDSPIFLKILTQSNKELLCKSLN
jgi:hypothetical protein